MHLLFPQAAYPSSMMQGSPHQRRPLLPDPQFQQPMGLYQQHSPVQYQHQYGNSPTAAQYGNSPNAGQYGNSPNAQYGHSPSGQYQQQYSNSPTRPYPVNYNSSPNAAFQQSFVNSPTSQHQQSYRTNQQNLITNPGMVMSDMGQRILQMVNQSPDARQQHNHSNQQSSSPGNQQHSKHKQLSNKQASSTGNQQNTSQANQQYDNPGKDSQNLLSSLTGSQQVTGVSRSTSHPIPIHPLNQMQLNRTAEQQQASDQMETDWPSLSNQPVHNQV